MANTITNVIDRLLAQALPVLRTNAVLPRLFTKDYQGMAAQQGDVVNVPLPPTIATNAVTPAITPPANVDTIETTTPINLSFWREAVFYMTDKEQAEVMAGSIPKKAAAAIAALADYVDSQLFTQISIGAGIAHGTAGTAPFATLALAQFSNTEMNTRGAMKGDRHVVFNAAAEANLIALDTFSNSDFVGDKAAIMEGEFNEKGRRLGANWWQDENTPSHTIGTASGKLVNNSGPYAIGTTSIELDSGSGTILAGDVVTFAGDTNKYVVKTALTGTTVVIAGVGLRATLADNVALTVVATHTVNAAFHSSGVALVSRVLQSSAASSTMQSVTDPVTGLSLRLEVSRQHKQDKWSFDVLFGADVIRPETTIKILG